MTVPRKDRRRDWALALIPVALAALHMWQTWVSTSADVATYLAYAQTLTSGHGFALQPGMAQSLGVASPLWVFFLMPLELLNLELVNMAKALGGGLGLLFIWLLPGLSRRLSGRDRLTALDFFPALVLAASPVLVAALVSGDETGLYMLVLAWTLISFIGEELRFITGGRPLRDLGSLLPALLLLGCRPEAPLLLAALLCWRLMARLTAWRLPRTSLVWLLCLPICYGLFLMGSYMLFADLWSGVITSREALVELQPGSSQALSRAWSELRVVWSSWGGSVPLMVVALLGGLRSVNYWGRTALLAICGANLAGILLLTGVGGGRLALPLIISVLLLGREGLGSIGRRLWPLQGSSSRKAGILALVLGLAGPVVISSGWGMTRRKQPELGQQWPALIKVAEVVTELGWDPGAVSVLTNMPGSAALFNFKVFDASGLTDPAIRRYSGNRRPLELQQLIFRERQPDVIIESGLWKVVHNLQRYPEASRLYIPLLNLDLSGVRVSLARRLVLEHEPWPDQSMRVPLGRGLELLGIRVEPGSLVLLMTLSRPMQNNLPLHVQLGKHWAGEVSIGPEIYPVNAWRPGELVRTRIALPNELAKPGVLVRLGLDTLMPVATLDLRPLAQEPQEWEREVAARLTHKGDRDLAETIAFISRQPLDGNKDMTAEVVEQAEALRKRGLIKPAIRQLQVARSIYRSSPALEKASRELAAQAYEEALGHIRGSRWTSAFALLRSAARADPASAWIARRLEQARRRMPAGSHLVEELELELARRALVLAPMVRNLERVMGAHLALGQYQMVIATAHTWKQRISPSRKSQYLLAKALVKMGRLVHARDLVLHLLSDPPKVRLIRRCSGGVWPKLLLLQAELLEQLGSAEMANEPTGRFLGRGKPVGNNSVLFSHCVRWVPGRPLEVDLYIWQREPEVLHVTLNVGSRLERLTLPKSRQSIRLVRKSFWLPPASYPVRLQGEGMAPVALGTVKVGPEITFGFELPGYPGWKREGTAFGRSPVVGRSFRARKLFGYVGERYADSYHQISDWAKGRIISPPFLIRRSHLMMLVAAGTSDKLGVDLLVEGKRRFTVRGKRSETMRLVILHVGKHRGKWARIVIRDRDQGKWGHIAVDEIRQIEGPIPGVAP